MVRLESELDVEIVADVKCEVESRQGRYPVIMCMDRRILDG